jgi:hypothetical protein
MGAFIEIIWPLFRRAQLYDQEPRHSGRKIDFRETGVHQIDAMNVQLPSKFCCGIADRQMLPLNLCWGCTVHKMQGIMVCTAVRI